MLKDALGLLETDKLAKGVSSQDMKVVLDYVVEKNEAVGRKVGYVFKRVGRSKSASRPWTIQGLGDLLSKEAKYIVLGSAARGNEQQKKLIKQIELETTDRDKLNKWDSVGRKRIRMDHAVGISVGENEKSLIDNGLKRKRVDCNVLAIAKRMSNVSVCYKFDLYDI